MSTNILTADDLSIIAAAGLMDMVASTPQRALRLAMEADLADATVGETTVTTELENQVVDAATTVITDAEASLRKDLEWAFLPDTTEAAPAPAAKPRVKCDHCDVEGTIPGVKRHMKAKHSA
jgi:hypothetical protein